jgi:hypothetical protein
MRKTFCVATMAVALAGCGGPVLGTMDASQPPDKDYSTQLTYVLPVAYFPITIKRDNNCNLTASLDKPVFARDPEWNLRLNYYHHGYTNDTLSFQTDDVGLLAAINTTSENQSLSIINQAFTDTTGWMTLSLPLFKVPVSPPQCSPFSVTEILNPLVWYERDNLEESLTKGDKKNEDNDVSNVTLSEPYIVGRKRGLGLGSFIVGGNGPCDDGLCVSPLSKNALCTDRDSNADQCIYFRRMQTFAWRIADRKSRTDIILTFQAPDTAIYAIPMRRNDFVKFDVRLTFSHGVLTGYTSNDPSKMLAVLQIPSDLIKGIVGLDTSSSNVATGTKKN